MVEFAEKNDGDSSSLAGQTASGSMVIDSIGQAKLLLRPMRVQMLRQMVQPATCPQLAEALGITMQKAYYHVKVLEKAGLVRKLGTRQARGIQEGIYQAVAQNYLLSPRLTESLGGVGKAREHVSLGLIQSMAEDLTQDIERLSRRRDRVAAAGVSARIELDPSQRAAFIAELQEMVQGLARKYGDAGNAWDTQSFKLLLACYEEPSVEREEL